ncbi:hypothetical protein [Pseudohongiella spirulinae]|uniref:Uncharacterized protein n=1 Tax=Pseudohongiella spirulinae TaxID=1249552 RepID=A0A0S2K953_9GAMM|nr:hypothetical protein [Pseudohongiella spirulinae]ALO44859.1 hypothetical protein PS2015_164 [Pseudohongiella spirulinae]
MSSTTDWKMRELEVIDLTRFGDSACTPGLHIRDLPDGPKTLCAILWGLDTIPSKQNMSSFPGHGGRQPGYALAQISA